MQDWDDNALLREYVERDSQEAFAVLVARHINKIYSVALRHTGNPHSAEEITQVVFVILAKKARELSRHALLAGWLYKTAQLTAITFLKSEVRRAQREEKAHMQTVLDENEPEPWPHIAPLLDAGLAGLSEKDRHAIVLRFFDGKNLGEVGQAFGTTEDAAKKRVGRALEKLRKFFTRRGVVVPAGVLITAISAHSVQAAPAALATSVAALAAAKGVAAGTSTLTLIKGALKLMAWTKAKTAIVIGAVVILTPGITTIIVKMATAKHVDASARNPFRDSALWISPFTAMKFDGDIVTVTYHSVDHQLAGINGVTTQDLLDFARGQYRDAWQKRLSEDLLAVLEEMGHPVTTGKTVGLQLIDPSNGNLVTIDHAAMTVENRRAIYTIVSTNLP